MEKKKSTLDPTPKSKTIDFGSSSPDVEFDIDPATGTLRHKLTGSPANFVNPASPPYLVTDYIQNSSKFFDSTGSKIGGTISVLEALDLTMKQLQDDTIARLQPGIDKQLVKFIEPIKLDLDNARNQIQEAASSLTDVKGFIEKNQTALTTLFSVDGRMIGLQSELSAFGRRLDKLEANKFEGWQKNTAVIGIVIGVMGACFGLFACIFAGLAIYLK